MTTINDYVLIIDNGGGSIKLGFGSEDTPLVSFPNVTAKIGKSISMHSNLIGDQVIGNANGSNLVLSRPCDRGYINNWQCQIDIWNYSFNSPQVISYLRGKGISKSCISPRETSLVLTEPPLNPDTIQNETNEVVFEYFQFKEYVRRPSIWFSAYEFNKDKNCSIDNDLNSLTVVDSGFSFTHSVPFVNALYQKNCVSYEYFCIYLVEF